MIKKKVIIYGVNYYPPKGGTSTVAENLILQLRDKYDITIYCYKNESAKDHIAGVNVVEFKPMASGELGSLLYFLSSALHILFKGQADLIHAHKTDCAPFIPLLRLKYKVIATSHEAPYKRDKWSSLAKVYFHLAERIFIHSPNVCTSISNPLVQYYEEKYHKKVFFIPNGINLAESKDFDIERAKSFIPLEADIKKPFIFFSARRLMGTKGCHTMLEALAKINYTGQVFIAGELDENSKYLHRLKKLSIGLNVYFLGFVNPLPALLALVKQCELFIFPSETEGMSIMLLEVASVGKLIIASDIPENTQVFNEHEVLYFNSSDADDLGLKISQALANRQEMQLRADMAKNKVCNQYLWSSISLLYEKAYRKAIG